MAREINLMAQFTLPERARQCAEDLRAQGFDIVQVDSVDSGALQRLDQFPVVEWGRYGYQPSTVDDKWTAASSWDNPTGLIDGESWLLTAVVEEEDGDRARTTIRQHGGII